jgi:hypothetical protein
MLLSALNPPPVYFGFVSDMMGISSEELRTAIYRQATYQAAMRISIRDLDNIDGKLVQVVDRSTAFWLGNLIAHARIEKAPGNDIVPCDRRRAVQPKSDADRVHEHRTRLKQDLLAGLDELNQIPPNDFLYKLNDSVKRESVHVGTLFRDVYDTQGLDTQGLSALAFRNLLAESHQGVIAYKEARSLISPGVYDPNLSPDTKKGLANLVSLSGIWLDNDGGDLAPDAFAKMLRVPMCIFNSYSSTPACPRWRVWIPTSHLITVGVHKEIIAQIRKLLKDRKFYGKTYIEKVGKAHPDKAAVKINHHGFDEGKFTASSSFYMPAQASAGADASFFLEFNWQNDLLNPYQWVDRSITDHRAPIIIKPPVAPPHTSQTINEAKVDKATAGWRAHGTGEGNAAYFKLAVALRHTGLSWPDAESRLRYEAMFSHGSGSAADRLRDLKTYRRKLWGS